MTKIVEFFDMIGSVLYFLVPKLERFNIFEFFRPQVWKMFASSLVLGLISENTSPSRMLMQHSWSVCFVLAYVSAYLKQVKML